ncbi:WRKY DNA-binding transcription factor 70 [Lactuca sativa]|uniref:WRKY domain-containing protein n=1 Tax=Lactuca sativa TaxID=4236 RepID=A0A9R1WES6_LACSA|nr:WRKY DNA-binding transcription factor 70 [Lactuca sativa]KAJ0223981.1 hypothetical protein LSAT_V11C200097170 [Lactuca sativa]
MEKNKKRLNETLIKGEDSAKKLQALLCRRAYNDGSVSVEDLVMEILGSFSRGLSMLRSCDSGEFAGAPASPDMTLATSGDQTPEVKNRKKPAPALKERRGCYKRRRTIDSRVITSVTIEDGYAWRKYGQKMILNSQSPRCYYRCTHKPDHGCKAQKQVQKLEDESNMYHITYFGHHTCPTLNNFSHSGVVLDFNGGASKNPHSLSNSPSAITNFQVQPSIKQEVESKTQSTDVSVSDNVSSANDGYSHNSSPALEWNEIWQHNQLGSSGHEGPPFMWFDNEDSCASTSSHGYLDMDFLNNDGFSSDFLFDEVLS